LVIYSAPLWTGTGGHKRAAGNLGFLGEKEIVTDSTIVPGGINAARRGHPGFILLVAFAECMTVYASGHACSWWISTYTWRTSIWTSQVYDLTTVLASLSLPLCIHALGGYHQDHLHKLWQRLSRVWAAWCALFVIILVVAVGSKSSERFSRVWLLVWLLTTGVGLLLTHLLIWKVMQLARDAGYGVRRVVLVGAPGHTNHVMDELNQSHRGEFEVVGRFGQEGGCASVPLLGAIHEAPQILHDRYGGDIDEIWVLQSGAVLGLLDELFYSENLSLFQVRFVPDLRGFSVAKDAVDSIGSHVLIGLGIRPFRGVGGWFKSVFDRVVALAGILILSPVLLLVALAIRIDSQGPIIYQQMRHGLHGREFTIFKFRTLKHADAQQGGKLVQVRAGDLRFTRVGRFLRRYSIDELPQLLNVLRGEMSLVGPRPHEASMNQDAARLDLDYRLRHRVLPGMTGWAQVQGSRGPIQSSEDMKERLRFDLWYIDNWSFLLDLDILIRTIALGLFAVWHI